MQLFFAGGENHAHLNLLKSCGVTRVAVSITNLYRLTNGNVENWASRDRLDGLEWAVYADSPSVPVGPVLELLKDAEVQPEIITGPIGWYEQTWLANSDLLFLPMWDGTDPTTLRDFTENYDGVTLPDTVVDNPAAVRQARASISRLGQLAGLTGRSKGIERFDTLLSSAWWSVQKYGETQVWDSNRLTRLNAQDKRTKRERYIGAIEALGCDSALVIVDDPVESSRLAIKSWLALEDHLVRGRAVKSNTLVTSPGGNGHQAVVVQSPGQVANGGIQGRHVTLPVIGSASTEVKATDENGNEVIQQITTIQVTPESLRRCNTCVLAVSCPMHTPDAACSYAIPVMIQSKPQLVGVMRAVTEIQTQRVLMGRFSEEVNGQPDPEVGKEMDRLFGMIAKWRDIEDNRDTVKMTLEAKGHEAAGMGVLSRLFGQRAGHNAVLLEEPIDSNSVIESMTD